MEFHEINICMTVVISVRTRDDILSWLEKNRAARDKQEILWINRESLNDQ